MSTVSPTNRETSVRLHSGRTVTVVITDDDETQAIPITADSILSAVGGDLDDAVAVAVAIENLLLLGDAAQRAGVKAAARLDATVATVEAARAAERDQ